MLVLYETPAGYALFKTTKDSKLANVDSIFEHFQDEAKANKFISFQDFSKFKDTNEALEAATSLCEGTLSKQLKSFLKKSIVKKNLSDKLAVADATLGNLIKEKLGIPCVCDAAVQQLYRGIRSQLSALLTGLPDNELRTMTLGLSHSLSRHKIKFSPDKVDTMIIQAIALLDELDKELNTYAMRVREWYGWHFPELVKIVTDTLLYAKIVKKMGVRTNAAQCDLSSIMDEDTETEVKEAAELSMGTEISQDDIEHIEALCDQVISISEYRTTLYDYIKNRMAAIAPNLTVMVGELVGARLIAHAGSLLNLAKAPASTVQILGAEKALFRALKTKHETPKYGLIYHASLVGQSAPKNKGKISRVLAGKTSLAARVDALGDVDGPTIAFANREKVEARLRTLEGIRTSAPSTVHVDQTKYVRNEQAGRGYNQSADVVMMTDDTKSKKRKIEESEASEEQEAKKSKKEKKEKKDKKSGKKEKKSEKSKKE